MNIPLSLEDVENHKTLHGLLAKASNGYIMTHDEYRWLEAQDSSLWRSDIVGCVYCESAPTVFAREQRESCGS